MAPTRGYIGSNEMFTPASVSQHDVERYHRVKTRAPYGACYTKTTAVTAAHFKNLN